MLYLYFNKLSTYVGPPSSVVDLTAEQQKCNLSVQWKSPYLLPGLNVSYNVTLVTGETMNNVTSSTKFISNYCCGDYCVNVIAFNRSTVGKSTLMYSRGICTLNPKC